MMDHIIDGKFIPEDFRTSLIHADTPELAVQALRDNVVERA